MYFSKPLFLILITLGTLATSAAHASACRPFRVHLRAENPKPPPEEIENDLGKCIEYYEKMDMDGDGVPDWTSRADGVISDVLYPNDDDMDGDGVPNVLDPEPLNPKVSRAPLAKNGVPSHLALEGKAGDLQGEIYRKYGLIAIDHTDHHSAAMLEALLLVLKSGIPANVVKNIKSVRYVYAFHGHDSEISIAAYHRQAKAISIGGTSSYGEGALSPEKRIKVIAAFAHEMGHAFLFDRMTAGELRDIGTRFGNWKALPGTPPPTDLHDGWFFRSHPLSRLARLGALSPNASVEFIYRGLWKSMNFVSQYASTNLHEWFADNFAAGILNRLGDRGALGDGWKDRLARLPEHSGGYWVNYNNLSSDMRTWLEARFVQEDGSQRPSGIYKK